MHKKCVAARRVEKLHEATPALVAAAGRESRLPAVTAPAGGRLDLHTHQVAAEARHEVVVRVLEQRLEQAIGALSEPQDG
jgi:hypothetical protein